MGLIESQVEPQLEVTKERGITCSDDGVFLFGLARNASSHCCSEGNLSERAAAVSKRAGWVDQQTTEMYLKDVASLPEEEDSFKIGTQREHCGGNDNGMTNVSDSGNCCNEKDDKATKMTEVGSLEGDSSITSS